MNKTLNIKNEDERDTMLEGIIDEPQITSEDPNERKLARRLRIEKRLEAVKDLNFSDETQKETEEQKHDPVFQQIHKSAELLEKYLEESNDYLQNVHIGSDSREVDRRNAEILNKEKIVEQLDNEAKAAQEAFEEIAGKWSFIQKYRDPLLIHDDMLNQKEKCDMLIAKKDEIIAMLRNELTISERKFEADQKLQTDDLKILTERVEKQVSFMRKAYQNEYDVIVNVILNEREQLLEQCARKWEENYKKRAEMEEENSAKKFEQLEHFEEEMKKLRVGFQEYYRETKISLENTIEDLQRELERIKALALLNREKLDYNYQILKKREDETIIIKAQQRRKINKLQNTTNELKKRNHEYELEVKAQVQKLEENIKKLNKNILDVETKADDIAKCNNSKFMALWKMNAREVHDLMDKILMVDKTLHVQQLGVEWVQPTLKLVPMKNLKSYRHATKTLESKVQFNDPKASEKDSIFAFRKSEDVSTEGDMNAYNSLAKQIFLQISDKSGFLSECKILELLKPYSDDEKALIRIDHVFEALNVKDKSDIDLLISYFIPYMHCSLCKSIKKIDVSFSDGQPSSSLQGRKLSVDSDINLQLDDIVFENVYQPSDVVDEILLSMVKENSEETLVDENHQSVQQEDGTLFEGECAGPVSVEDSNIPRKSRMSIRAKSEFLSSLQNKFKCNFNHPLEISSIYISQALMQFVQNYRTKESSKLTIEDRLVAKNDTMSRLISEHDIDLFWNCYKNVFSHDNEQVWDTLYEGLQQYYELLKARKAMSDEVLDLRAENHELKTLLKNYHRMKDKRIEHCDGMLK